MYCGDNMDYFPWCRGAKAEGTNALLEDRLAPYLYNTDNVTKVSNSRVRGERRKPFLKRFPPFSPLSKIIFPEKQRISL
jgi:hypothetical protein